MNIYIKERYFYTIEDIKLTVPLCESLFDNLWESPALLTLTAFIWKGICLMEVNWGIRFNCVHQSSFSKWLMVFNISHFKVLSTGSLHNSSKVREESIVWVVWRLWEEKESESHPAVFGSVVFKVNQTIGDEVNLTLGHVIDVTFTARSNWTRYSTAVSRLGSQAVWDNQRLME